MRISSKYITTQVNMENVIFKMVICSKGISMYSKCPSQVLKAISHLSPDLIHIRLYTPQISRFEKIHALFMWLSDSVIKGRGYLLDIVILLSPQ